ncbi:hypothetical protein ERJ75_001031000 [Trypanosoma vivax]|nr:hypothetical protein ERJ75_001031000 [Trypanosoma vivax]
MGKDKASGPLFNGRSVLRRARITRVTAEEERRRLPLQKANVGTLSLEWVRCRLGNKTLRRFGAVWRNVPQVPELHSSNREPQLRMRQAPGRWGGSASLAKRRRSLRRVGLVPFAIEENPAGLRRRFVAWAKGKNDHGDCEAEAPPPRVPCHLDAAFGEVAAVFDLKASFFQVSLPQGSRASFRCCTETDRLVEFVRVPMGYKCSPEMLHAVARAFAGNAAVVSLRCAAPRKVKMRAWIGVIRISGPRRGVEKWGRVVARNMGRRGATLGESNCLAKKCGFIGVLFGRGTALLS